MIIYIRLILTTRRVIKQLPLRHVSFVRRCVEVAQRVEAGAPGQLGASWRSHVAEVDAGGAGHGFIQQARAKYAAALG